ncbi:hypothetical protein SLEP1_g59063 [Rubroshorea leprosula]|uniref:Uncharacterized protein n=1 Tax=Rubroshorea leprosula TaxID=152421 RepID=A0AAV5MSF9_9ROSI|nr:hypothetical protein SLEP1_g59063 [Rubroshorea leprosula]
MSLFFSSFVTHCSFFNTCWRIETGSASWGLQGFLSEEKERIIEIMELVTSSRFNKAVEPMETPIGSFVKEDAMGTGGQSLDKVRENAMNKAAEFVNGDHPFAQFPWIKKSIDLMGLNMMDVYGGLTLVDYFKEANQEFNKKQKLYSAYCPTVPAFPILGFSIPKKQGSNRRKAEQCSSASCPVPPFPVLLLSVPKKQRSNRGKPLIITTGSGFLKKFGARVLKDFETRFSDAELVERKRNKSKKRCRESEESEEEMLSKPKRHKDGKIENNRPNYAHTGPRGGDIPTWTAPRGPMRGLHVQIRIEAAEDFNSVGLRSCRNIGGAEQDHLSETDDERTPTGSTEPARTTELEERTRVLEMAMGRILARLIPDDLLIPLLNRDAQPAAKKKQKVGEQWGKPAEFPKYASYIPLTLPRSQILAQIQHWVRRPPPPLHDSLRVDKSKHCDYHRVYGHNTEDCQHLKDELEFLARNGKLEGYVQKPHTQQPTQTHFVQAYDRPQGQRYQHGGTQDAYQENQYPTEQSRVYRGRPFNRRGQGPRTTAPNQKDRKGVGYAGIPPPSGTINMISGGVHSGGQSARARKAYARRVMTVNKDRPLKRPFEEAEWENTPITFSPADYKRAEGEPDIMMPHADPFVATVHIGNHNVNKVFIDTGSSPDILYWGCFQKMQLNPSSLQKHEGPIYGFDNQPVPVEGVITLPIYVGSEPRFRMASVTFLVVKMESAFNAILGRATLCELKAIISQPHLCMKFPTPQGVGVLKGNQKMARACYHDTFKKVELAVALGGSGIEPVEPVETVPLNPDVLERTVKVGTKLTEEEQAELLEFLRVNQDVFAWTTDEMPGIPAELTVHKLSTDPTRRPVVQKRRLFGPEKQAAIDEEIQKLLQAGFIRRVEYSEWVSNPVLIKNPNGKWRMCIDFTNLNDACPKDPHPLPNVEKLVERAAGHARMSFLDANSGYHQVQLLLDDQEKTAFYAGDAIYCYVMMPFGLKNAGATYQKLVQIIFKLQIGRNIEVYVDDMIVTSVRAEDHIGDLDETFQNLRRAQMKLNPLKCTFAVESGKFLGYVVSQKGIEVNPEKVEAVQQMEPPRTVKDVQRLTGRVAALHRFIARSAERCLPFFKALREPKNFQWTNECQQAFDELKRYLASAPLLSKPVNGECLYLYLGVTEEAVSSVLLREEDKHQKPICYVSKVLQGAEQNYPLAEKAAFALVYTARKLRAYFQSHQIVVYTDLPLRKILQKPELSGRLIGWSVELSEYALKFQPRTAVKGQVVADFLVECISATKEEKAPKHPVWVLYVDGAANAEGSGAGALLLGPDGFKSEHALRFKFQTTNNAAEYEALIYGLKLAAELKVQSIQVFSDSQLVVGQVNGRSDIRDPQLSRYASVVNRLKSRFASFQIDKISRADNHRADELSKLASSQDINPQRSTIIEVLDAPSYTDFIVDCQLLSTDPSTPSWTTPLINYLQSGELPEDLSAAKLIKRRAAHFTLLDSQLYKQAASMPLLHCLTPYEAEYAVREVHEGVCGTHIGGKTLARKLLRHGYYWPTMVDDTQNYVKKCPTCQFNADDIHMPREMLSSLASPWPFAQWGVDLLGPFIKGKGGCTFLVVAVDYFTKWIEAKPLSTTTERKIEEFLFNSILCRFGIPKRIIADNGPQFRAAALRLFCDDYGIELALTSVYTPQSNGQAESVNKIVLRGLKTRVLAAHSNWVDELNKVLWSCRTTPRSATCETPFSLAYGAEAVIPVEVGLPSERAGRYDDLNNEQLLRENLDFIEEVREMSRIRNVAHQSRVAKFYNKRVRARQFQVGDLVLRKAGLTNIHSHMGKLAPNWEGPYMVVQVKRPDSYVLADIHGRQLPYLWNVQNLRKFYS